MLRLETFALGFWRTALHLLHRPRWLRLHILLATRRGIGRCRRRSPSLVQANQESQHRKGSPSVFTRFLIGSLPRKRKAAPSQDSKHFTVNNMGRQATGARGPRARGHHPTSRRAGAPATLSARETIYITISLVTVRSISRPTPAEVAPAPCRSSVHPPSGAGPPSPCVKGGLHLPVPT